MADLTAMLQAAAGQVGGINPREYFNTVLYTGNGTTQSITGVGFQPDWVWLKVRSTADVHKLTDAVRGATKTLFSNTTDNEFTEGNALTSFDADGFSLGSDSGNNGSGRTFVAWNWKANGAGVSNTDGTIASTVSVSTTSGFSIVTFTGNGTNPSTVGHGLGVAPSMVIVKSRSATGDWWVYHKSVGATKTLFLQLTDAELTFSSAWNDTAPTSTVFTVGTAAGLNVNGVTQVAYCFAEVEGFSKISSYTGNGSATGPSVTTDFEPTWLMIKRTDSTGDWIILDSARDATNPRDKFLEPNTGDAEATGNDVDFNATGFQLKSTSASINASGGTYIYACFA